MVLADEPDEATPGTAAALVVVAAVLAVKAAGEVAAAGGVAPAAAVVVALVGGDGGAGRTCVTGTAGAAGGACAAGGAAAARTAGAVGGGGACVTGTAGAAGGAGVLLVPAPGLVAEPGLVATPGGSCGAIGFGSGAGGAGIIGVWTELGGGTFAGAGAAPPPKIAEATGATCVVGGTSVGVTGGVCGRHIRAQLGPGHSDIRDDWPAPIACARGGQLSGVVPGGRPVAGSVLSGDGPRLAGWPILALGCGVG